MRSHGKSNSKEYKVWGDMIQRCQNPKTRKYEYYGGRGIKVCDKWQEFQGFYQDMGDRPEGLTLERRDSDGDYSLDNCKWASWKEQHRNKRNNNVIEFDGQRLPITEWAEHLGIHPGTLNMRIRNGWSVERALTTPPRVRPATKS